jgi:zinc transporter ZupT
MTNELPYWTACLYGLLGAGAILLGGGLVAKGRLNAGRPHPVLTGMGAGFLIALGALSALPEAYARSGSVLHTLVPALLAFAFVLFVHRLGHRGHGAESATHGHHGAHAGLSTYDARLVVAGLALHALLDGVAVSAALADRRELGIFVAVFIVLHKAPEGAAAAALIYASGGKPRAVQLGVVALAIASAVGALTIIAVGPMLTAALSVAAGVTSGVGVGVAGHLVKHRTRGAYVGLAAGMLLFVLCDALLHA